MKQEKNPNELNAEELEIVKRILYPFFWASIFSGMSIRFEEFCEEVRKTYSERSVHHRLNRAGLEKDLKEISVLLQMTSISSLTLEANDIYRREKTWRGRNVGMWTSSIHKAIGNWLDAGPYSHKVDLLTRLIDQCNQIEHGLELSREEQIPPFNDMDTDQDLEEAA